MMATLSSFEDMEVWKRSRLFANDLYNLTVKGSFERDFRLRDQINGSAGSIMDNIAEGFERDGKKEFLQFLSIAKGSAGEVRAQLYRALDRNHISPEEFDRLKTEIIEISKQISGLMKYLSGSDLKGTKYKDASSK
jgi:four helix bundle protein